MQPDGYVKIKDRSKDIIISGGENISSLEVEDVLYRHPGRAGGGGRRAARPEVGRDAVRVRRAEARRDGRPKRSSSRICRAHLARFKVPKKVVFGDAAEDLDRQDPEVRAARAGEVDGGDRVAAAHRVFVGGANAMNPRVPQQLNVAVGSIYAGALDPASWPVAVEGMARLQSSPEANFPTGREAIILACKRSAAMV